MRNNNFSCDKSREKVPTGNGSRPKQGQSRFIRLKIGFWASITVTAAVKLRKKVSSTHCYIPNLHACRLTIASLNAPICPQKTFCCVTKIVPLAQYFPSMSRRHPVRADSRDTRLLQQAYCHLRPLLPLNASFLSSCLLLPLVSFFISQVRHCSPQHRITP